MARATTMVFTISRVSEPADPPSSSSSSLTLTLAGPGMASFLSSKGASPASLQIGRRVAEVTTGVGPDGTGWSLSEAANPASGVTSASVVSTTGVAPSLGLLSLIV